MSLKNPTTFYKQVYYVVGDTFFQNNSGFGNLYSCKNACAEGHVETIKRFLKDVEKIEVKQIPIAFGRACAGGYADVVEVLLEHLHELDMKVHWYLTFLNLIRLITIIVKWLLG